MKVLKSIAIMLLLIPCLALEILFKALETCFTAGRKFMDNLNDKLMAKALKEDENNTEEKENK